MMSCFGLVDGKLYLWSADHIQHISLEGGDRCCGIYLHPLKLPVLWSVPTLALKSQRMISLSVLGVSEIILSNS